MNRAVAAARQAFDEGPWPRLSHAERAVFLREIAKRMKERIAELSFAWTSETGATNMIANLQIGAGAEAYNYYVSPSYNFAFEEPHVPAFGGNYALLVREPVGVVGSIIPWNGPVGAIAYKCAPALSPAARSS